MRYSLLAAASLIAVAFSVPANAEDCGCRDQVRAALARQAPAAAKARPAPMRRTAPVQAASSADGENFYDYRSAGPVDMAAYRHRWDVAPQGYVPPPPGYAEGYGEGYGYAQPAPMGGMAHYASPGYPDGWANTYRPPGIEIDQQGWFGGVGYGMGADGGGGGGGGGMTLTLAQPDAANGYGPGSGGSYGATNQVNQWRAEAFAPKASK